MKTTSIRALVFALLMALGIGTVAATPAVAGTGLIYRAVDSDNDPYSGIYLRNGTSMANVDRVYARYLYYGNSFELICGTDGESVGPNHNRRWHKVYVTNGPAAGQTGWIADRYADTPNKANQATPGEPECGASTPAPLPSGGAVYFQPRYTAGDPQAPSGVKTMGLNDWSAGDCSSAKGGAFPTTQDGKKVTTLAGWSAGRLGPTYGFVQAPDKMRQINQIILFDPGSQRDYFDGGLWPTRKRSCDLSYDQSGMYADWLSQSSGNHLLILAGAVTRDQGSAKNGYAHRGIQEALFPKIRGKAIASQVIVCNYDTMSHPDVLRKFAYIMKDGQRTTCPGSPNAVWHP